MGLLDEVVIGDDDVDDERWDNTTAFEAVASDGIFDVSVVSALTFALDALFVVERMLALIPVSFAEPPR